MRRTLLAVLVTAGLGLSACLEPSYGEYLGEVGIVLNWTERPVAEPGETLHLLATLYPDAPHNFEFQRGWRVEDVVVGASSVEIQPGVIGGKYQAVLLFVSCPTAACEEHESLLKAACILPLDIPTVNEPYVVDPSFDATSLRCRRA